METEIWKDVIGYEGLYQVSNLGRVKSVERYVNGRIKGILAKKKSKILAPTYGTYKTVSIGRKNNKNIHRLVAMAFIPNPDNKPCVNHIDGDKYNNHVTNLEWVTYSENEKHSYRVLGKKPSPNCLGRHGFNHHDSIPVIVRRLNGEFVGVFESGTDAANAINAKQANLSKVVRGLRIHTVGCVIRNITRDQYYQFKNNLL